MCSEQESMLKQGVCRWGKYSIFSTSWTSFGLTIGKRFGVTNPDVPFVSSWFLFDWLLDRTMSTGDL
jgi:hypothetical protein